MPPPRLVDPAVRIIKELFGPDTAEQYRRFYSDKTDEVILTSLDELLHEILGPREAKVRLEHVRQTINRTSP